MGHTPYLQVLQSNTATLTLGLPKDFGMRPISIGDESEEETETEKVRMNEGKRGK